MEHGCVTVPVKLTAKGFRDFAIYDTLVRQRRWVAPVVFFLILSVSAGICYALRDRGPNAGLLVGVLLAVGLGLPAVYFLSFFNSIRQQNRRMNLSEPKAVYTVTLDAQGVHVDAGEEHMDHLWTDVYQAHLRPEAIYLYPSPKQAYLLPYADTDPAALKRVLAEHLPAEKLVGRERA